MIEMAEQTMPGVVALRAGSPQPFQADHQVDLGRLQQQVIAVAHHHPGMHAPTRLVAGLSQRLEPELAIPVIAAKVTSLVATSRDLIGGASLLNVELAGHFSR